MTRAIAILAACAAVAWLWRRRRHPTPDELDRMRHSGTLDDYLDRVMPDPMDGVQWDPYHVRLFGGGSVSIPPGTPYSSSDGSMPPYLDPTYLEATTLAAIRRSAQSADVTTEGMS